MHGCLFRFLIWFMNQKNNFCLLTNDVETTSIWHNSLRDSTGKKVFKEYVCDLNIPRLTYNYEKQTSFSLVI